ncbi:MULTISPECIES: oxygen-regulated invasion protein OrgB [Pseudomonas]|uniref:oxygen-regulated invasion protein OrgB n=1 Tax=Pseudomonas TaxID=286 RepID=UPI001BE821A7|nr:MULTISPECIES: oxygen-regulated invasion protein OrgB [Pseudomonas]MBT2339694.1 oxygen-regulated invasion protein OrgB [Pseudomonas fluorescens]MCD4531216.1 oxygen-regulated invasion protein OrgB [Pseudomonas sp. C3-2018]
MLDSIRSLVDLPDDEEVRLAREDIAAARRRHALQREAQRRARECVEQAQREAEAVRAQAFQQGYGEGILRAAGHLAQGLSRSQSLGLQLRNDLAQAAGDLLRQALSCPQWLEEMLERWLAGQPSDAGAVLQLVLPQHCRSRGPELRENLRKRWAGELILEYHPQDRYVLRLADQLLEFDVETIRERLAPRLLASLADLPASVRALDQASLQALTALCASFSIAGDVRHED